MAKAFDRATMRVQMIAASTRPSAPMTPFVVERASGRILGTAAEFALSADGKTGRKIESEDH